MYHTEECLKARAQYEQQAAVFLFMHPNVCFACGGAGGFSWSYDPSPAGVSLGAGYLEDAESCALCEGDEDEPHCGLCGQPTNTDGERLCGCSPDVFLHEGPECFCWYEEEKRLWDYEEPGV
jgi:hypothetical protein